MERVLSSEVVYQGRLFRVRKDELEMVAGRKVIREVVEHPGAVAIVPLLEDGSVIMVEQYRHPARKTLLEIPAGTLAKGESPEECARRELMEETGMKAKELKKLLQCYVAPGYSTELIHIFVAKGLSKAEAKPEFDEHIKTSRLKLPTIIDMIKKGEIEDAKTICAILILEAMRPR
ncbi:MAG: NUDIX hydrolase [Nitrososphaerota archaeon]